MAERLVGWDLRDIGSAARACVPGMSYTPWDNVLAHRRVFAGIEMAMWDARARTEGQPLHRLLGGAIRQEIPLTEYFSYRLPGAHEPGEDSPLAIARYCARMIEAHDAQVFEGKVATVGLEEEVRMVAEVRQAIGARPLGLDANGLWTLPTARQALRQLSRFDIAWFEEPCESYEEMAALRPQSDCFLLDPCGRSAKGRAAGLPGCHRDQHQRIGRHPRDDGLRRRLCRHGVGFRFHSGETGVASAAYLHLSAALDHVRGASQTLLRWYGDDVIEGGPFRAEIRRGPVPEGPGLGVTLDPVALQRCHERYLLEGRFPAGATAPAGSAYGSSFRKR